MKEVIDYKPLSMKVLAVSVARYRDDGTLFDWAAYVDAVEGQSHEREYKRVAEVGSKLPKDVAVLLFGLNADRWRQ